MVKPRVRLVIAVAALLVAAGGLQAREPGKLREKKQKLKVLKKEIAEERTKAQETAAKEAAVVATLKKIDRQLRRKARELKALEVKLRAEKRAVRTLKGEISRAELQLQEIKQRWARRVRALYKQGQFGVFRLLFSAESFTDIARRMKYLRAITAQDQALTEHYAIMLTALNEKGTVLKSRQGDLARGRSQLRATRAEIADEKWRQRILLARVREEKEGHLTAIRELRAASTRLQELIKKLSKRPSPAPPHGPFAALKGKLPWPTAGVVTFRFGRQENGEMKTVIFNKGIGIRAPPGRQIKAVYDGTVLYADWFRGYGKLIILDHGHGFYTLYGHASGLLVRVGDAVRARQDIGQVGETGSLEGPQLYFELRYEGEPEDPLVWLSPRR